MLHILIGSKLLFYKLERFDEQVKCMKKGNGELCRIRDLIGN